MKCQVIYSSRGGHTKKVADAIASEMGVEAQDVKEASLYDDSFVFFGSGCYGGNPSKAITKFIEDSDIKSKDVALFGTSAGGQGSEVAKMESILISKEAHVKGKFFCKGQFFIINRGRPNEKDLQEARNFARRMTD